MDIGMVGLGRMGLNMATRLVRGGHRVVGLDLGAEALRRAGERGVEGVGSHAELLGRLAEPRIVWLMIPVGKPVDDALAALTPGLGNDATVVDGGNSWYRDSVRRGRELAARGAAFVDCGTSGGVWGLENGYCLMLGGEEQAVRRLTPALDALAPPDGWRHLGAAGAGHFAKMVHNAIEYGMLQAYAEGFELLHESEYDFDLHGLSRLWNRGGVVRSWLLELAERAFAASPELEGVGDWVEDSGMGRWSVEECVQRAVPAPVLALSLFARFRSRQQESFSGKVVAALRREFGGHAVREE